MKDINFKKAKIMHEHMLSEQAIHLLAKEGIYSHLIDALKIDDFELIERKKIYFNIVFSPQSTTNNRLKNASIHHLITIDFNATLVYSPDEMVAITLHEIGHSLNPDLKGEDGETIADKFAIDRGYILPLITSIEMGMKINPQMFDTDFNRERLQRLKDMVQ